MLTLASVCHAQANTRVFHLDVDPIHGDDTLAMALNPRGTGSFRPLQVHPASPALIRGELQQAAYSFRTVTAAIAWVNSLASGGGPPLPWTNAATAQTIRHVVIHCRPGLYGPRRFDAPSNEEDFDAASGLPWNGETFPIHLPGRVSIQGTSALDTIFDARNYRLDVAGGRNLFWFQLTGTEPETAFDESFIDSIAMRGCRYAEQTPDGAALVVYGNASIKPSVSNCFIYGNDVGIAIKSSPNNPTSVPLRPRIVANTIAWNQIGIINLDAQFGGVGIGMPFILDNLIDPIRPTQAVPTYLTGIGGGSGQPPSCFEGISAAELTASVTGTGACSHVANFNGYHDGLRNLGTSWPYGSTVPRPGPVLPPPVQDLAPVLGPWPSPARAEVFIADLCRLWGPSVGPHDLRLSPMVRRWDHVAAQSQTYSPNPVVNLGISTRGGPVSTINGTGLLAIHEPGMPNDDQARFTAWDWDCEGFGNPREARRTCGYGGHFAEPWVCAGFVDLGADEMGELIGGGFLDSTRIFTWQHSTIAGNTVGILGAPYLYFFNVVCAAGDEGTYLGPQFNLRTDPGPFVAPHPTGTPHWYAQLGGWHNPFAPAVLAPYGYTDGKHTIGPGDVTRRHALTLAANMPPGASPFPHFVRSRTCDVGPHLADDILPNPIADQRKVDYAEYVFQLWPGAPSNLIEDAFQANPWCNAQPGDVRPDVNDNGFLYGDRTPSTTKHLKSGTISPPMVVANDPLQASFPKSYLFRNLAHPIGYWQPSPYTYTVSPSGIAIPPSTVPYIAGMEYYGVRVNLEMYDPDSQYWSQLGSPVNNVQTFLIVMGEAPSQQVRAGGDPVDLRATAEQREEQRRGVLSRMLQLVSGRRR